MAIQLKQTLRRAWHKLPESRAKDFVRMGGQWKSLNPARHPMLQEISQLPIEETGETAEGIRYLRLQGGPCFYSFGPRQVDIPPCTHAYLHRHLPSELRSKLPKSFMDMAADVVCRYKYPHADPTLTPPYPNRDRGTFHPQHRDTVEDIQDYTLDQKKEMHERFRIHRGEVVLDIGSYIGYGALRLSQMVGEDGKIVSVEADHRNQGMFHKNMQENGISNVDLVPRAIWSEPGSQEIFWNDSQLNSLVDGIVAQRNTRTVETDSVDNIVKERGLTTVSLVSLTVNGAEIEALHGMDQTLRELGPRLSIAGWYEREGVPVHKEVTQILKSYDYRTKLGRYGRVYAWPATKR